MLSLERGTLRLTRLIDNLLESVRIESGQLDVRRQSIELARRRSKTRAGWSRRCCASAASRSRSTCPTALDAAGRRHAAHAGVRQSHRQCQQVRARGHARSASARASKATRSTAWVEDAGPGLPEGDAVSIFERFKRGGSQEPEPGGLGLGLWISRSIVERHGGSITAARTADGFTRFTFTLPVEPTEG